MKTALIVGGLAVVAAGGGYWWWRRRSAAGGMLIASRFNSIDRSPAGNFTEPYPGTSPYPMVAATMDAQGPPPPPPPGDPPASCPGGYHIERVWEDSPGWPGWSIEKTPACVADPPPPYVPPAAAPKKKGFWGTIGGGIADVGKAVVSTAVKVEKVQLDQFKQGAKLVGADKKIPGYDSGIAKVDGVIRGAA